LETGSQPCCLLRVNNDLRAYANASLRRVLPLLRLACLSKTILTC